jgi:hypothetical protein
MKVTYEMHISIIFCFSFASTSDWKKNVCLCSKILIAVAGPQHSIHAEAQFSFVRASVHCIGVSVEK